MFRFFQLKKLNDWQVQDAAVFCIVSSCVLELPTKDGQLHDS